MDSAGSPEKNYARYRNSERGSAPRDDAIHEIREEREEDARDSSGVEADNGRGLAKSAKRLLAINRRLSALRDADVMLETLQTLRVKNRRILSERCFARVHRRLSFHKKSMMTVARRKGTWRRVGQSVRKIRQDAKHWKPNIVSLALSRQGSASHTSEDASDGPCQEKPTGRRFP